MERVYNFSAGPSMLPEEALRQAQKDLLAHGTSGMSVMEMSHRSKAYLEIIRAAEQTLRDILAVPGNYKVLFIQGGATMQFSMVPLNLMQKKKADYVQTGQFASKAIEEAARFGAVNIVASSKDKKFNYIPALPPSAFDPEADYFHITLNNTIYGTRFTALPETGSVPLVTDMSSSILSVPCDVSKYGLIYAGAQKNIGPAGLCIVIIREDLVGRALPGTPVLLDYQTYAENESMYNTPPTFAIYMALLVFQWIKRQGGLEAMERHNREKAALLYDFLDSAALLRPTVAAPHRSLMNIPFVTGDEALDKKFIKEAEAQGLVSLAGHRSVGGMRASIYNAMPLEGVQALVAFMKKFETENK
jgi:phosphoserine aminotransferase